MQVSDYYCNETLKKIVEEAESTHSLPHIGGCLPQNNMRFIQEFKELIKEKSKDTNKKLIIDMALTRMECKENLFDCLQKEGKDIVHIILTADKETIAICGGQRPLMRSSAAARRSLTATLVRRFR